MELSESRLSVLFRKPLDAEMQSAVIGAVEAIVKERGDAAKPPGVVADAGGGLWARAQADPKAPAGGVCQRLCRQLSAAGAAIPRRAERQGGGEHRRLFLLHGPKDRHPVGERRRLRQL